MWLREQQRASAGCERSKPQKHCDTNTRPNLAPIALHPPRIHSPDHSKRRDLATTCSSFQMTTILFKPYRPCIAPILFSHKGHIHTLCFMRIKNDKALHTDLYFQSLFNSHFTRIVRHVKSITVYLFHPLLSLS